MRFLLCRNDKIAVQAAKVFLLKKEKRNPKIIINCTFATETKKQFLKSLFTIVLSIILLLPSFGSFFVYTSFKLNQDEIVKTICVQRKMVNNTCNGRCELDKSIKKYNDNEKRMQNNLDNKVDLVFIQNTVIADNFKLIEFNSVNKPDFYALEKKTISVSLSSFRPPSYFI